MIELTIEQMRKKIDKIDAKILSLIEERVQVAKKIGESKRRNKQPIYDNKREGEIIGNLTSKTGLNKKFVRKIFESIIQYCRENE